MPIFFSIDFVTLLIWWFINFKLEKQMHMFLLSCKECWAGPTISSWIFLMNSKHNSSLQLSKSWKVDFDGIYLAKILNGNATSFPLSDSGHLQRNTRLTISKSSHNIGLKIKSYFFIISTKFTDMFRKKVHSSVQNRSCFVNTKYTSAKFTFTYKRAISGVIQRYF